MTGPPSIREIAELIARLRPLSAAGTHADGAQRAVFRADTDALIARIPTDAPHPTTEARGVPDEPVSVTMPPQWLDGAERRRTEPVGPDNPEELAARLEELRGRVSDTAAAALALDPEQERRAQLALWHTDDHLADGHAAVRTDDGDTAGWSR